MKIKTQSILILSIFIFVSCGAACSSPPRRGGAKGPKRFKKTRVKTGTRMVERVIDGDTVALNGGDRVRINNINTPEIDEELGREAKSFAKALVEKQLVKVLGNKRDGYGRVIGDLMIEGNSLADQLVQNGLAHVFLIPPIDKDKKKSLLKAQKEARAAKLGIWKTSRYQGDFHITSFHANPRGNDNFNLNGEYLRIVCISDAAQSLKGYMLRNRAGDLYVFDDVVVPPGYTFMIHSGHGDPELDHNRQIKLYWGRTKAAWRNKGDTATLLSPSGAPVDEVVHNPKKRKNYR